MLQITEDTPPDMLAGAMDLTVHLPSGHSVRMSVERSTPMMDLLVQITAKHQLQLSNHTLQPLSMAPWSDEYDRVLPYKPNTPIGTLDTQHVKVVAKNRSTAVYRKTSPGHQPFESTFRLKVFLPRNQLFVTRVHTDVLLEDIMRKVCEEKCLDPRKYEFRHPGNLDEVLDPKLTLSDYQITEIYLAGKGVANFSQTNITVMRKEEEVKQMHNKTGGGVFNLIFRRGKAKSSSSLNTIHLNKDDSPEPQPPPPPVEQSQQQQQAPKAPQRKRRPAPKPPSAAPSPAGSSIQEGRREEDPQAVGGGSTISEGDHQSVRKADAGLLICHSRNSSDSSGYHEASVLSENNASLPRRPKSALVARETEGLSKMYSRSVSNLSRISSKASASLNAPGRKRKPAPPPPPLARASETTSVSSSQQMNSIDETTQSSSQQYDSLVSCHSAIAATKNEEGNYFGSTDSGIAQETLERNPETEQADNRTTITPAHPSLPVVINEEFSEEKDEDDGSTVPETKSRTDEPDTDSIDWQYQLPSPPKAFKDTAGTAAETVASKDVGVPYSELFEKLKNVEETQTRDSPASERRSCDMKSDAVTSSSCSTIDEHPDVFRKYTDVMQELRSNVTSNSNDNSDACDKATESCTASNARSRSVTPNMQQNGPVDAERMKSNEIAVTATPNTAPVVGAEQPLETSNKAQNSSRPVNAEEKNSSPTVCEKFQNSSLSTTKQDPKVRFVQRNVQSHALPNFKISTYNEPKQKITVFEDDTIRSNRSRLSKTYFGGSFENLHDQNSTKEKDPPTDFMSLTPVSRSESFSSDVKLRSKPVSRSKSHLNLNPHRWKKTDDPFQDDMYRSNSLYDVSGLQSLEVIRLIQTKLTTSTTSLERSENHREQRVDRSNTFTSKQTFRADVSDKENNKPSITYRYHGPPSINMGTWSERPKVTINENHSNGLRPRPRSVNYDTSRVPVVRSVELKKHVRVDGTLISPDGDISMTSEPVLGLRNNRNTNYSCGGDHVSRINIYKPTPAVPVVRGFDFRGRSLLRNRNSYLNGTEITEETTTKERTEDRVPPVPPAMPQMTVRRVPQPRPAQSVDTRAQLLAEIRNFGGKKGFAMAQI